MTLMELESVWRADVACDACQPYSLVTTGLWTGIKGELYRASRSLSDSAHVHAHSSINTIPCRAQLSSFPVASGILEKKLSSSRPSLSLLRGHSFGSPSFPVPVTPTTKSQRPVLQVSPSFTRVKMAFSNYANGGQTSFGQAAFGNSLGNSDQVQTHTGPELLEIQTQVCIGIEL